MVISEIQSLLTHEIILHDFLTEAKENACLRTEPQFQQPMSRMFVILNRKDAPPFCYKIVMNESVSFHW